MSVQGKKAKDRSNFPTAMSRFCLFFGFVVFWLFFFFKNASCFNFPPRYRSLCALCFVSVPLCAGAALSFSLSLSHPLCLSGRQTATQTAQDGTFVRMWRHSHTQADTLIEMSYLLSRQDYMHIAILFREQDDTQLQTRWWLHTEIQCTEYTSSFNTAECVT